MRSAGESALVMLLTLAACSAYWCTCLASSTTMCTKHTPATCRPPLLRHNQRSHGVIVLLHPRHPCLPPAACPACPACLLLPVHVCVSRSTTAAPACCTTQWAAWRAWGPPHCCWTCAAAQAPSASHWPSRCGAVVLCALCSGNVYCKQEAFVHRHHRHHPGQAGEHSAVLNQQRVRRWRCFLLCCQSGQMLLKASSKCVRTAGIILAKQVQRWRCACCAQAVSSPAVSICAA